MATILQRDPGGLAQGFVDLDLGSSPGWWATTVATCCPFRMVEHPKSNSTQPSRLPDAPDCSSRSPFLIIMNAIFDISGTGIGDDEEEQEGPEGVLPEAGEGRIR